VEGFFHAHVGWLFKDRMASPEIYAKHLLKDPIVMFVSKTFFLWVGLSLLVPFLIGGWTGLLWGGLVRIFLAHHVTWSVNSVCHTFGKREFETTDQSRNEWLVGLLGFGEGWHNNHHAFPRSAFHGLHWWQFDLSGYVIWTLERIGLVKDVYRVTPEMLAKRSTKRSTSIAVSSEVEPVAVEAD
jgi:stearoyl-CoA desaturase (delta-9 desaturase)